MARIRPYARTGSVVSWLAVACGWRSAGAAIRAWDYGIYRVIDTVGNVVVSDTGPGDYGLTLDEARSFSARDLERPPAVASGARISADVTDRRWRPARPASGA